MLFCFSSLNRIDRVYFSLENNANERLVKHLSTERKKTVKLEFYIQWKYLSKIKVK